jgi:hypothetical protein
VRNAVPTTPGGGTVEFVDAVEHAYLDDPVAREEGGTPAIVESIRAGLVLGLKQAIGTDLIQAREERMWRRALRRWGSNPQIQILGSQKARRLAIVSLLIRHGDGRYLHHNFVVALLNDLFGIQARGGCSCAGPYGHRLLGIDRAHSRALRREISNGCDGVKPGWVRVNFNYFISAATADFIMDAVDMVAADGHRLLPDYRFNPRTGLWRHATGISPTGITKPPLRLSELCYGSDGELAYPTCRARAEEDVFPGYLRDARELFASRSAEVPDGPTGLTPGIEALRWFPLPPACLGLREGGSEATPAEMAASATSR